MYRYVLLLLLLNVWHWNTSSSVQATAQTAEGVCVLVDLSPLLQPHTDADSQPEDRLRHRTQWRSTRRVSSGGSWLGTPLHAPTAALSPCFEWSTLADAYPTTAPLAADPTFYPIHPCRTALHRCQLF